MCFRPLFINYVPDPMQRYAKESRDFVDHVTWLIM